MRRQCPRHRLARASRRCADARDGQHDSDECQATARIEAKHSLMTVERVSSCRLVRLSIVAVRMLQRRRLDNRLLSSGIMHRRVECRSLEWSVTGPLAVSWLMRMSVARLWAAVNRDDQILSAAPFEVRCGVESLEKRGSSSLLDRCSGNVHGHCGAQGS